MIVRKLRILFKEYAKVSYLGSGLTLALLLATFLIPSKAIISWGKEAVITTQEDIATLGYSGQRKIVDDNKGNFYVTYRKNFKGYYQIFVSKVATSSSGWMISGDTAPITVVEGKIHQRVPSIAIDSKGVLHVAWYGSDSPKYKDDRQVKYSRSLDSGKTWSQWINIAPVPGYSGGRFWQEHPNILVGKDNTLYAVWEGKDLRNKNQQIKFTRSLDGGNSWSSWINIKEVPGGAQSRPTIVQDSTGRLHIIMYSTLGSGNLPQIQYSYSDDGGIKWSNWENISNPLFDSRHISVAVDKQDILHVVWRSQSGEGKPSQIFYTSLSGGEWTKLTRVSPSRKFQFFPSLAVDTENIPYVIWMESSKGYGFPREAPEKGKIYFSYAVAPGQFSKKKEISSDGDNFYPVLPSTINTKERDEAMVAYTKGREVYKIVFDNLAGFKE